MVFITDSTKQEFLTRMDEWGDSYTDEITIEELQEVCEMSDKIFFFLNKKLFIHLSWWFKTFDLMPLDEVNSSKRHKLADEVEERYFADSGLPNCLFRRCVIYIDYPPSIENINGLWALYEGCRDRFVDSPFTCKKL
jgi:hypothetical protein